MTVWAEVHDDQAMRHSRVKAVGDEKIIMGVKLSNSGDQSP